MFINQINKENYKKKKKLRCLKDTISQNNYNFRFNYYIKLRFDFIK